MTQPISFSPSSLDGIEDELQPVDRRALLRQRRLGRVLGARLLWPAVVLWMIVVRRYRIRDVQTVRRRLRELLSQAGRPVLVCANHLTWIDSLIIQWAFASLPAVLLGRGPMTWNVPEQTNFCSRRSLRLGCYLGQCVPIIRGGDRGTQKTVIYKLRFLMTRGEVVVLFPEGGRSRTGRVDLDAITYGPGRLIGSVGGCSVLCLYLRGDRQDDATVLPARGERFTVLASLIEPTSNQHGLRAARETSLEIGLGLVALEEKYFAGRE